MKLKDVNNKEKILNKNLSLNPRAVSKEINGQLDGISNYSDQPGGIVRIVRNSSQGSEEDFHTMQEQHNANHALYYFNMLADNFIQGKSTGSDCRKLLRAREHMMNLREFIREDKSELKTALETLIQKLEEFCPVRRKQFGSLLLENWQMIRLFAMAYLTKEQRCLTDEQWEKLKDVLSCRCYIKLWWWKSRGRRFRMKIRKFIKGAEK